MITKSERETRARELILAAPIAGRREIAKQLRSEGLGMRDAAILALQREAYPERRRIIVEPYQLAKRVEGRYRPVRRGRYNRLVKANFSAEEARKFSRLPLTRLSFIKDMEITRKKAVDSINQQGKQLKWSKTQAKSELKAYLAYTYKEEGWVDDEGEGDAWAMLRAFRKGAIDRGEYRPREPRKIIREDGTLGARRHSTPGQKARYRSLHKDAIKVQAATYRQKQREQSRQEKTRQ